MRSLLSKLDFVRILADSTGADVIVLSETWLNKSVSNADISHGYNVYRTDRPQKGGGIAIYVRNTFCVSSLVSKSIPKQFEILALNIEVSKGQPVTVVGCYRPPSAVKETLSSLANILSQLDYKEIVMLGDLNWDWLTTVSDDFKNLCISFNLALM